MTRDEYRAKCIEAMARGRRTIMSGTGFNELSDKYMAIDLEFMTAAFDALHCVAFVEPLEATEEMIAAITFQTYPASMARADWRTISIIGDLTNQQEKKLMATAKQVRAEARLAKGCLGKAHDNEPVFVLRAQDKFAAGLVVDWADCAEAAGCPAAKVEDARAVANAMARWHTQKLPD